MGPVGKVVFRLPNGELRDRDDMLLLRVEFMLSKGDGMLSVEFMLSNGDDRLRVEFILSKGEDRLRVEFRLSKGDWRGRDDVPLSCEVGRMGFSGAVWNCGGGKVGSSPSLLSNLLRSGGGLNDLVT